MTDYFPRYIDIENCDECHTSHRGLPIYTNHIRTSLDLNRVQHFICPKTNKDVEIPPHGKNSDMTIIAVETMREHFKMSPYDPDAADVRRAVEESSLNASVRARSIQRSDNEANAAMQSGPAQEPPSFENDDVDGMGEETDVSVDEDDDDSETKEEYDPLITVADVLNRFTRDERRILSQSLNQEFASEIFDTLKNEKSSAADEPYSSLEDQERIRAIRQLRRMLNEQRIPDAEASYVNSYQVGGQHYGLGKFQHWDMVILFNLDYFQGQITKYVMRWRDKNGIEDLEKAAHYLEKYIDSEKTKKSVVTDQSEFEFTKDDIDPQEGAS